MVMLSLGMLKRIGKLVLAGAGLAVAFPGMAWAHPGHDGAVGFASGFVHPVTGFDHVLAMVAVGLFAANLGGRALWAVPLTFVAVMAAGGALAMAGIAVPMVETGIAASVVVLGLAVALRWKLPVAAAMALVGVFAIFHGHAHGAAMPVDASGLRYALGFMLATGLLHGAGIGLGFGIAKLSQGAAPRLAQACGLAMSVVGLGFLTGAI